MIVSLFEEENLLLRDGLTVSVELWLLLLTLAFTFGLTFGFPFALAFTFTFLLAFDLVLRRCVDPSHDTRQQYECLTLF